ncbi:ParA family protein (plasmid) [Staphylococcus xylosus]|uniref:ParA family protein n=1 Tax=Staphylococcus TaxID=1279 RepID=UPI001187768A|nr:ParA family protein [Staphylococcus xylosus]QDW90422.1 ParA family protein [Staphylococcus xylosus]
MTKVITVASLKGGVGKSEFVKELSKYLLERGNRVLMIDTDINHSCAFKYFKEDYPIFSNLTFINFSPNELTDLTDTLFKHFDYVVIDTMPYTTDIETPITLADMIVTPTNTDTFASDELVRLQKLVEICSGKVQSIDVVTYTDSLKYTNNREMLESIKNIKNVNLLKSKLVRGNPEDSLDVCEELINKEYIES